jgi:hypothetical protein
VPAAEKGEVGVIEGLDPEAHEADTEIAPGRSTLRAHILGVRLEEEQRPTIHQEISAKTIDDLDQLFGIERRWRAATEIYGIEGEPEIRVHLRFTDNAVNPGAAPFLPCNGYREIAVGTD